MAKEVLLSAQTVNVQQISCCFWDYSNGNALQVYKHGGAVAAKSLNLIGSDYIVSAESSKPLLHVWPLNSAEPLKNVRFVLPEAVNAMAVCPRGNFLAAGMGTKLYVWELSTGKLLAVQSIHYQPISCIRFSSGVECLLVAGEDGMLVAYHFSELIKTSASNKRQNDLTQIEPMYKRMDHSLAITDMHVEKFGLHSRFATVSLDSTMRLYQMLDGALLLTLVHCNSLTAIVMDCFNVYVGSVDGSIAQTSFTSPPSSREHHIDDSPFQFIGHKRRIVALDVNIFATRLASAADDNNLLLWDIQSRQMLKRIELKSAPTNLRFVLISDAFFAQNAKRTKVLSTLERSMEDGADKTSVSWLQTDCVNVLDALVERSRTQEAECIELLQARNRQLQSTNIALLNRLQ